VAACGAPAAARSGAWLPRRSPRWRAAPAAVCDSLDVEQWWDGSWKASSRGGEETFMACGRIWCMLQSCVPYVSDVS
jgi:hypothetical protein